MTPMVAINKTYHVKLERTPRPYQCKTCRQRFTLYKPECCPYCGEPERLFSLAYPIRRGHRLRVAEVLGINGGYIVDEDGYMRRRG